MYFFASLQWKSAYVCMVITKTRSGIKKCAELKEDRKSGRVCVYSQTSS